MNSKRLWIGGVFAAVVLVALTSASLALSGSKSIKVGSAQAAKSAKCGLGNGKKATGRPIKLGGIFTLVPGSDFTTAGKIAAAYFKCVNDNGGIRGRPISYKMYTEQLKPDQNAALVRKLVQSDKVVGVAGNFSLIECAVNHKYYKAHHLFVIGVGVPGECFSTPNYASVNMGPRYSSIGAAQALLRHGAKSLVISSPTPIAVYANGGVLKLAKARGIKGVSDSENLPITDANSVIQKLVQQAGQGGGVILDYTPETAAPLMKAAEAQGVTDRVLWGSSTPIANEFTAGQVAASKWTSKNLFINSEFTLLSKTGPDMQLYRAITKKYAPSIPIQSFGQFGVVVGKMVTRALLNIKGPVTRASYNAAVQKLKNQKTDILCKPWYFGKGLPVHIPNNWDITVTYRNGKVVASEPCFAIAAVDRDLVRTRAFEKKFKLNTG